LSGVGRVRVVGFRGLKLFGSSFCAVILLKLLQSVSFPVCSIHPVFPHPSAPVLHRSRSVLHFRPVLSPHLLGHLLRLGPHLLGLGTHLLRLGPHLLGLGPHLLGLGPHLLGLGPHLLGLGPHLLGLGPHLLGLGSHLLGPHLL